jgi:hypothetical protein
VNAPRLNAVDVAAVVIEASKKHVDRQAHWTIKARIVRVLGDRAPKVSLEQEHWLSINKLTGTIVNLSYSGPILTNLSIRSGILFRLAMPAVEVEKALLAVARDEEPEVSVKEPEVIRPMNEPCVRVPLSILRELRGQEAGIEYSRRALVRTWSQDRRTGKAASK